MKRWCSPFVVAGVLLTLLVLGPSVGLAQCAMCRTAFESPEGQELAGAYRAGILFLLPFPFATFATVTFLAIRNQRLTLRAFADSEADPGVRP